MLRQSLSTTVLVKTNVGYAPEYGIFEIGRAVDGLKDDGLANEKKLLAITLYSKTRDVKALYFELRDILATITDDLKHKALGFTPIAPTHSYEHPINLNEITLDGEAVGVIGIAHPEVGKKIDKKANIVFAEVDMQKFSACENASIRYAEPSKFPPMTYDLSLELRAGDLFSKLREAWDGIADEIMKGTRIVDTYDTETIHSITVRFEFGSNERTLSSAEVQDVMDKVIENLSNMGIRLRG